MENANKADEPGITNAADADANTNVDTNGANNLSIAMERATGSKSNGNTKITCPKIINFSINNIIGHDYFI